MKKKTSIRRICKFCKIFYRNKKIIMVCFNGKHKKRQ
nr:ribosomal protein L36 [Thonningia sanguinea]WJE89177.1 ribosomal protein L36 [Thonningia sanguinea]